MTYLILECNSSNCGEKMVCNGGYCVCQDGYTGEDCHGNDNNYPVCCLLLLFLSIIMYDQQSVQTNPVKMVENVTPYLIQMAINATVSQDILK